MTDDDRRVTLNLRMTETTRQRIAEAAKRSLRSMNQEILYRLQNSLEQPQSKSAA